MARLDPSLWAEIRRIWEFAPEEPTYLDAANQAAAKFGFEAPKKTAIDNRAKREGWERRGSLTGVNASAQRKADRMVDSTGAPSVVDAPSTKKVDASTNAGVAQLTAAARTESEDKRAEVLARHRTEWQQVAVLRQEALARRAADAVDAFNRAKLAKITAEMTMIQQVGERRAWGMDTPDAADVSKMTDAQLEALVKGKG